MSDLYGDSINYGYVITYVQTKAISLLKEDDYSSLQQCETIEDTVVKLTNTSYHKFLIQDIVSTRKDLKRKLNKSLLVEFNSFYDDSDFFLTSLLDYYINCHKIKNFVYLLACKEQEKDLKISYQKINLIGDFPELCALKVANDMSDVFDYCVKNTFLESYYEQIDFKKNIEDNDWQVIQSQFTKNLIERFYNSIKDVSVIEHMEDILKIEGDKRIIELVMNVFNNQEIIGRRRRDLFPEVNTLDLEMLDKLSVATTIDDLKGILSNHNKLKRITSVDEKDILQTITAIQIETYKMSLEKFNDISCVYAYLKLKEIEIKNILFTVDATSKDNKELMKNII